MTEISRFCWDPEATGRAEHFGTNPVISKGSGVVSNVPKQTFLGRAERWLVGVAMAAMAYMIEMAVLRSIRRRPGKVKTSEQALGKSSANTEDTR